MNLHQQWRAGSNRQRSTSEVLDKPHAYALRHQIRQDEVGSDFTKQIRTSLVEKETTTEIPTECDTQTISGGPAKCFPNASYLRPSVLCVQAHTPKIALYVRFFCHCILLVLTLLPDIFLL